MDLAAYRNANVMVFGAAGFIGRWVARSLTSAHAQLTLVVRQAQPAAKVLERFEIGGDIVETDLADADAVRTLMRAVKPQIVFNLAGYGVDPRERDPALAQKINCELVEVIAESVADSGVGDWTGNRVIHVGSALEYGTASGSLSEETQEVPTTLYGASKLAGTRALERVCVQRRLRGVTARCFTVYGPGEAAGRLLPSLLHAARQRNAIELTSGDQQRDFTYVEDVAEGLLRLGRVTCSGEPVNIATGKMSRVREFVECAAHVLGIPPEHLEFGRLPTRVEEMSHDPVAIARLQRLTSWKPPTDIADGVRRTLDFEKAK